MHIMLSFSPANFSRGIWAVIMGSTKRKAMAKTESVLWNPTDGVMKRESVVHLKKQRKKNFLLMSRATTPTSRAGAKRGMKSRTTLVFVPT